jgi:hypothetical protein
VLVEVDVDDDELELVEVDVDDDDDELALVEVDEDDDDVLVLVEPVLPLEPQAAAAERAHVAKSAESMSRERDMDMSFPDTPGGWQACPRSG